MIKREKKIAEYYSTYHKKSSHILPIYICMKVKKNKRFIPMWEPQTQNQINKNKKYHK